MPGGHHAGALRLALDQKHGMDVLAENELGYRTIPITDPLGKKGKNQKTMDIPPGRGELRL